MKLQSISFNKQKYNLHDVVQFLIKYHIGVPNEINEEKNYMNALYLRYDENKKYIYKPIFSDSKKIKHHNNIPDVVFNFFE
jgi:hypothetical protein